MVPLARFRQPSTGSEGCLEFVRRMDANKGIEMNVPNPIQSCTGDLSKIPFSNESPVVVFELIKTATFTGIVSHGHAEGSFVNSPSARNVRVPCDILILFE